MKFDASYFLAILSELVEENPLACQGVLSIAKVEFTTSEPTLAVTISEKSPRLLVNLDFISANCTKEVHIKALILHEFLHVLLNHTGEYDFCDLPMNFAFDAVINHIIHRSCGPEFSEFFRHYYKSNSPWIQLLAPPESQQILKASQKTHHPAANQWSFDGSWYDLRYGLLNGTVLADDILDIVRDLNLKKEGSPLRLEGLKFLGNHNSHHQANSKTKPSNELIIKALSETFRQLNGDGIFRNPGKHGFPSASIVKHEWEALDKQFHKWEKTAWAVLQPLLCPDPKSKTFDFVDNVTSLPILNGSDRRGFLRSLWNPITPDIGWNHPKKIQQGTTQIYLDVSGSMNAEMQSLVTLFNRLRRWIKTPFWAFSDQVATATIQNGILRTSTTGGTSMNCVLTHIAETKPKKVLVITDGYIEPCNPNLLDQIKGTTIHCLISRDGSTEALNKANIPCTQLCKFPNSPNYTP